MVTQTHSDSSGTPESECGENSAKWEQERAFRHVAGVLGCEEGDPMFAALVRAGGGMSMRRLASNIKDKPPDEVMQVMGKGDDSSDHLKEISEAEWNDLVALGPYLLWSQNCWGPADDRNDPLNHFTLSSGHFSSFYVHHNDVSIRNHYKVEEAREYRDRRHKEDDEKRAAKLKEREKRGWNGNR